MTREERIAHIESMLGGVWRGMISASSLIWLLSELRTADEKLAELTKLNFQNAHEKWIYAKERNRAEEKLAVARAFVEKLVNVHSGFAGVFQIAAIHGFQYDGPSYEKDLLAVKEALEKIS